MITNKKKINIESFLHKGFTLIELLVSISIITVIMSVVLFSYGVFNDTLVLNSAVQEISIAIRQAQIYGLSVKENVGSTCGTTFCAGYGIYFNLDDKTNYYIFVDQNNNSKYDGDSTCAAGSECIEKDTLRNGIKISGICGKAFLGSMTCPVDASVKSLNVTFLRPIPDAIIRFTNVSNVIYGPVFQTGRIDLTSPKGKTASITIENTGQISVQ